MSGRGRGLRPRKVKLPSSSTADETCSSNATDSETACIRCHVKELVSKLQKFKHIDDACSLMGMVTSCGQQLSENPHFFMQMMRDVYRILEDAQETLLRFVLLHLIELVASNGELSPTTLAYYNAKVVLPKSCEDAFDAAMKFGEENSCSPPPICSSCQKPPSPVEMHSPEVFNEPGITTSTCVAGVSDKSSASFDQKERNNSASFDQKERNYSASFDQERNKSASFDQERNKSASFDQERNKSASFDQERNKSASFDQERNKSASFDQERNKSASFDQKERNNSVSFDHERNKSASFDHERNKSASFDQKERNNNLSFDQKERNSSASFDQKERNSSVSFDQKERNNNASFDQKVPSSSASFDQKEPNNNNNNVDDENLAEVFGKCMESALFNCLGGNQTVSQPLEEFVKAEKEEGAYDAARSQVLPSTTGFERLSSFRGSECGGRLRTGNKGLREDESVQEEENKRLKEEEKTKKFERFMKVRGDVIVHLSSNVKDHLKDVFDVLSLHFKSPLALPENAATVPNHFNQRVKAYSREFLLECSSSAHSRKLPCNWSQLSEKYPEICLMEGKVFAADSYCTSPRWILWKSSGSSFRRSNSSPYPGGDHVNGTRPSELLVVTDNSV